ncbi:MAG: glycosyl hydrolase 53 family protein [Ruminococcus sp.]|nr:glycosyl hydrolase 53 family protein [Ruminococcus sp.]
MKKQKIFASVCAAAIGLCAVLPDLQTRQEPHALAADTVTFTEFDTSVNGGEPIRGVDISSILAIEQAGVRFYSPDGAEQDIFRTLSEYGVNYIRVRVWNSPYTTDGNSYGGGNCDVNTAAEIGRRAAQYGMKLLVDLQYSDFWADPGKQTVPKAWQGYSFDQKKQAIYDYTKQSLQTIRNAGADIGMVQVGNETNCVFCGEDDMYKISELFSSGCAAVRDFDRDVLIALHFANPATGYFDWYAQVLDECAVDYDVFAASYYSYWHGTTENLTAVLKGIGENYDKYVMVAETAYPYTDEDGDSFGNAIYSASVDAELRYAVSVDGQAQCLTDVFQAVANVGRKGIGAFYWEPAWLGVYGISWAEQNALWEQYGSGWATAYAGEFDASATAAGGSSYDNQALFDFSGRPMKSLEVFSNVYPKTPKPLTGSVIPEGRYRIRNLNSGLYLTVANGEGGSGVNVVQYEADGAAEYNVWHIRADSDGYYSLYSDLGGGDTYLLDLSYGSAENGTDIGIYTDTACDAQRFKFVDNGDGSYLIVTKSTTDQSAVEVADADTASGGRVQQFERNGHRCQSWVLEPVEDYYETCDLNGDGLINVYDFAIFKRWLMAGETNRAADMNDDGDVNIADMVLLHKHLFGLEHVRPQKHGTPHNTVFPRVD